MDGDRSGESGPFGEQLVGSQQASTARRSRRIPLNEGVREIIGTPRTWLSMVQNDDGAPRGRSFPAQQRSIGVAKSYAGGPLSRPGRTPRQHDNARVSIHLGSAGRYVQAG